MINQNKNNKNLNQGSKFYLHVFHKNLYLHLMKMDKLHNLTLLIKAKFSIILSVIPKELPACF